MYDSIIVGGGPAGLSAAINLIQRGKTPLVLNHGESYLAKAELVDNYLGMPDVTGTEMMDAFIAHAQRKGTEIRKAKVANIMPFDGAFMVNADGDILQARSIILATGIAKANPITGEDTFLGRGVSYCATCDGMLYRNRDVIVWGLCPEATHEANFLHDIGCRVTFVAGKRPETLHQEIAFHQGRITEITGDATVTHAVCGTQTLETDCVFILRSSLPPDALLNGLAHKNGAVITDAHCNTNIAGVFAAGDLIGQPLQVSNAVGDGLVAALACADYLDKL